MVQPPNAVPGPPYANPAPSGYLYQVGDIGVTADSIVTHRGTAPLAGSTWQAIDYSRVQKKIPVWAIIMAIVFAAFCLLGLLFLLVKEDQLNGYVEVRVQSGPFSHVTLVQVVDFGHAPWVMNQVNQIQVAAHQATT